jgi:hypothetical protein
MGALRCGGSAGAEGGPSGVPSAVGRGRSDDMLRASHIFAGKQTVYQHNMRSRP